MRRATAGRASPGPRSPRECDVRGLVTDNLGVGGWPGRCPIQQPSCPALPPRWFSVSRWWPTSAVPSACARGPVLFPTIFVDLVRQTAVSHAWQNPPSTGFVPPRTGHADSLGSQRRGRRRGSALTQHAIGNRREPTRYNGKRANRRKPEFTGPFKIRTSAMTCGYYRTSSPVTALPMITRWISDVPSKMVKLMEV